MIAAYTQRMMDDLVRDGETTQFVGWGVTESMARSRLYNAARRAGVRITTRRYPRVGEVSRVIAWAMDDDDVEPVHTHAVDPSDEHDRPDPMVTIRLPRSRVVDLIVAARAEMTHDQRWADINRRLSDAVTRSGRKAVR